MVKIVVCVISKVIPEKRITIDGAELWYIVEKNLNRPQARNRAIMRFKDYDWIAFIDSSCIPFLDWYKELCGSIDKADVITGFTYGKMDRVPIMVNGQDITWPTCNIAYRMSALRDVGGFDGSFDVAEDCELNLRLVVAGYSFFYNPRMRVEYRKHVSGWRQAFWYGYGRYLLKRKHPGVKVVKLHPLRLGFGFLGYLYGRICKKGMGKRADYSKQ
jgi:GT2 family glycosyltransferase